MHDFKYIGKELYCEKVKLSDIAKKVGTPVFVYSHKTFVDHFNKIKRAFKRANPLICYSMKANSNLAILRSLVKQGAGLDIVSGGELYRAKKVRCKPERIVFAGVGKSEQEIEDAIRYGILLFNVESVPELELIQKVAKRLRKRTNVSLRVNPAVDPKTHHHIATGKSESKFGMDLGRARALFAQRSRFTHVSLSALHVHIGSQIVTGDPFVEAFKKVLRFIDEVEKGGAKIKHLNLGGGLGVIYDNEKPQTAAQFSKKILPLFRGRKFRLVFEPGRFISANGGVLLGEVLYVKQTDVKNFAITNTAMNDLIRPSLYDAFHGVWPLAKNGRTKRYVYDVVGPICESGDVLAKDREIQELRSGDLVAIMSAGAYGFVMSSNYNSRPRAAEVLVKGNKFTVVKRRENYQSLIAGESIPEFV